MMKADPNIKDVAASNIRQQVQSPKTAALSVEGISHYYGSRQALDHVSFALAPATFSALIGLNGAGKSSLISLITRLLGIQVGNVSIFGHDIVRNSGEALSAIGVVFQPRTLDLDLSVTQNLIYHASLHGIGTREALSRADEELARIGLADRAGEKVRNLSGGQMRRVEIARSLLHRPCLLLLDEATVGLDVKARADIAMYVRHLVTNEGLSVLWATHLFDEVMPSDDLIVLHRGQVLAQGQAAHIVAETGAHDVHSAFMHLIGTPLSTASLMS